MSGTPTLFERYAVLGHRASVVPGRRLDLRVSLVLLSRGPWFLRPSVLTSLASLGFLEILCVESASPRYDAESLLQDLPGLRILVDLEPSTVGARINRAAREVRGDRFLVLWDDQSLPEAGFATRVQRLWQDHPGLVLAPERRDRFANPLPSVQVPSLHRDRLKILALGTDEENVDTLFPADYCGLYDRRQFLQTGGYDPEIENSFWQLADWGLRSRLWGESLVVTSGFKVDYLSEPPIEDQTPDRSYPRFFLRNLAVRHDGDHGVLPWSRFWSHAARSGLPLSQAWWSFCRERAWVQKHRYRFQTDARILAELWGQG